MYQGGKKKGRYPPAFTRHMCSRLHTENHDKSTGLHMVRALSESRYVELHRSKVEVEERGAEGD